MNETFLTSRNYLRKTHRYFNRSGFYLFLLRNLLKVLAVLVIIVLAFIFLEKHVIDLQILFSSVFAQMSNPVVFGLFIFSESFLGLIPPDFFILWAQKFEMVWLIISVLAVLSYFGGIVSYYLGFKIRDVKRLNDYLNIKFRDHLKKIRRWGAFFIVVAALFPLPYSIICMLSGIMRYPFYVFIWFGLARIIRFYVYALVLFGVLG